MLMRVVQGGVTITGYEKMSRGRRGRGGADRSEVGSCICTLHRFLGYIMDNSDLARGVSSSQRAMSV